MLSRLIALPHKKLYAIAGIVVTAIFALSNIHENIKPEEASLRRRLLNGYDDTVATLPWYFVNYANVWDTVKKTEQPLFWYIPNAGGVPVTNMLAKCLKLTQISPKGELNVTTPVSFAPPVRVSTHHDDNSPYLNLNPGSQAGMDQIASLKIVQSRAADVIVTPHVTYFNKCFDSVHKARVFAMIRHPVKRIIEEFYYRQAATWDPYFDPRVGAMSIDDFATSDYPIDNVMVRVLIGIYSTSQVTVTQLQQAKDVLRQKVVVGIDEWLEASVVRFEQYFGWWEKYNVAGDATMNACHATQVSDPTGYPPLNPGSPTWQILTNRNWADIELYSYAKRLFAEQQALINNYEKED